MCGPGRFASQDSFLRKCIPLNRMKKIPIRLKYIFKHTYGGQLSSRRARAANTAMASERCGRTGAGRRGGTRKTGCGVGASQCERKIINIKEARQKPRQNQANKRTRIQRRALALPTPFSSYTCFGAALQNPFAFADTRTSSNLLTLGK